MKHNKKQYRHKLLPCMLWCAVCFVGCFGSAKKHSETGFEVCYKPSYATSFYIEKKGKEKLLHIFNPWQGAINVEFVYHLCPRADFSSIMPAWYIPVPLQRVVCLSTTHIAFIDALDETATIAGVSGAGYVSNSTIRKNIAAGNVRDVGYETLLSYETIAALQPDAVFVYGINGEMAAMVNKLNEIGIRVVYLADYLEESMLGKAEYMVAIAAFYNKENVAIEYFSKVAAEYETIAAQTRNVIAKPTVILNAPWRDTWYMPGKNNYINKLLQDAGAQAIGLNEGRNSAPLGLETAYIYALKADYWLHPNAMRTLHDLKNVDARFASVPAFANGMVYNNTQRSTPYGGSDFWESGVVCPQIILKDLLHIFHPEILQEHELVYYEQLK